MVLWNLLHTNNRQHGHSWSQKWHTRENVKSRIYGMEDEED